MKKKLGILGGMGPQATSVFYERIIEHTQASTDQDHIWTIISSHTSLLDRTKVIAGEEDKTTFLTQLEADVHLFQTAEVANIAIPCNTSHYFYEDIQEMTEDITVINMVAETLAVFQEKLGQKALVLGSKGTYEAGIYEKYADDSQMELVKMSPAHADRVHEIIYDIKHTQNTHQPEFFDLLEELTDLHEPDGFILACTELSLIDDLASWKKPPLLDAMDVLVHEAIVRSGYEYKAV